MELKDNIDSTTTKQQSATRKTTKKKITKDTTDKKLEKLKNELYESKKEVEKLTEFAKRTLADLQNYKKRIEEDKASFVSLANAALILEILPILDSFNRAFASTPRELQENEWVKGIMAIEKQLVATLEKEGLQEIKTENGKFDPNLHEALMQGPGEKDTIIEELEKGYMLGSKVLRPAKVKIGNGNKNNP